MRLKKQEEMVYYGIRMIHYEIMVEELSKFEVKPSTPGIIKTMIRNAFYHLERARQIYPHEDAMELHERMTTRIAEQKEKNKKIIKQLS